MRYILVGLLILLAHGTALASYEAKIAVLDVQYLMERSVAYTSVRKRIDDISADLHDKMAKKEASLKKEEEAIIKKRGLINDEELQKEIEAFSAKVSNIQRDIQKKKASLEQAHSEAVAKIQTQVNNIVSELATTNNFDMVVPSSQILFAVKRLDITEAVLKYLNERLKKVDLNFRSSDIQG